MFRSAFWLKPRTFVIAASALTLAGALGLVNPVRAADAPAANTNAAAAPVSTGSVTGKVLDSEGNAVAAGVKVVVLERPSKQADGKREKPKIIATGLTQDGGTYTIDNVPPGKYLVGAFLKGTGRGHSKPVEVTSGTPTSVSDITLKKGEKHNHANKADAAGTQPSQ